MADGDTPSSVLTIEEREGKRRKLELRGPGLPKRGASWESDTRLVTEWYPGNSTEATQQVLGPMLLPSEWEGVWNTTRLISCPCLWFDGGAGQPITRADTLRTRFETLARSGALLRVVWAGAEGRRLVREGRIGPFKCAFDRFDDLTWSATFVWVSKGEGTGASNVVTRTDENLEASLRAMNDQLADLQSAIDDAALRTAFEGLPDSASDFSLGELETLVETPVRLLQSYGRITVQIRTRIDQVTSLVQTVETTPSDLAGQLADTATDTGATMRNLFDAFSRLPPELLTHRPERPAAIGSALHYFGLVLARARLASRGAKNVEQKAKRTRSAANARTSRQDRALPGDATKVHRPSAGDTFASLALKFYGDAGLGHRIAKANGCPAYQVKPGAGRPIVIPVLTGQDEVATARTIAFVQRS